MANSQNQTSDVELVLHITGYNINAYEQLYERYSPIVYTLIKKIIPDVKLAQSVLLNVFAVFLKRIEFYDTGNDNVFTWIMLLTRNISLDVLRRIKPDKDIPEYDDNYEIEIILPKLSSVISPIVYDASTEKIKLYKNHLTEVQNLVLSLAYFEGLNEEGISKRLNLPVITIKEKILDTMGSLMQIYRELEKRSGLSKEIIDLIKLDVLGCLSEEEKRHFNDLKNSNKDFLWKEFGDYQNLTALLATSLPPENPPVELTDKINRIFGSVLQGQEDGYAINIKPEPVKAPIIEQKVLHEVPRQTKQEFAIKFREPDPNPLFILKKQETSNKSQEVYSPLSKNGENITIIDRNSTSDAGTFFIDTKESHSVFVKDEKVLQAKSIQPTSERFNLNAKTNEPAIVKKEVQPAPVKDEKVLQAKTIQPTSERFNLNAKTNEPVIVKKEVQPLPNKDEKVLQAKTIQPTSERFNLNAKTNEPATVKKDTQPAPVKDEKVLQAKSIQPTSERFNPNAKTNEPATVKKETHQVPVKDEKVLQAKTIQPTSERFNLNAKTNEPTVIKKEVQQVTAKKDIISQSLNVQHTAANSDVKSKITEQAPVKKDDATLTAKSNTTDITKQNETKSSEGKITSGLKTKESINVDEIISMIEDEEIENILVDKSAASLDEVGMLKKKLRRNYYISAGVIIFLITTGVFLYLKFNNTAANVLNKNADLVKSEISLPGNSTVLPESKAAVEQNNIKKAEQKTDPVQTQSGQTEASLPLVEPSLSDKKIMPETDNNNLTSENISQIKENPVIVEEKTIVAPLSEVKKVKEEPTYFVAVEEQPQLVGGLKGIQSKIFYPEVARKNGIEGKVIVQAIVDENGRVISAKTIKGIGGGCDEVAMDAVKESKFIAGKQGGKPVKVQVTIPIVFKR